MASSLTSDSPAPLSRGELARKVVHMSVGLIAFSLRFLGPLWSALCALTAVVFNAFVLPRVGGKALWRQEEAERGRSMGIVLYPLAVLLLILIFHQRLEVAAAVWGILAFGDGMASVVGMTLGRAKLPWNSDKSWAGSLAHWLFGTAAAAILLRWTVADSETIQYSWAFALVVAAGAALLSAALESLPQGLDDNFGVPLLTGLFLFCLLLTQGHWQAVLADPDLSSRLLIGLVVNLVLAGMAFAARSVDISGVIAGVLLGTLLYGALGWAGFSMLVAFFVLGTACTKLGYQRKAKDNLAQEQGGRRGARHALANTGVAVACAVFAVATNHYELFVLGLAGAFATAVADTAGSEIGQLYGRRTFLLTTFRPVPRGTEGAVSLEGTLAGIAASALLAALGVQVGLFGWLGAGIVVVAAFLGTVLESLVGSTLEKRGLLDNESVNFLNTLTGALIAAGMWVLLQ